MFTDLREQMDQTQFLTNQRGRSKPHLEGINQKVVLSQTTAVFLEEKALPLFKILTGQLSKGERT